MALTLNNDVNNLKIGDYFWAYFNCIDWNFSYIFGKKTKVDSDIKYRWGISDMATKTDEEVAEKLIDPSLWTKETGGYFRFIVVDTKENGDVICIADRNVAYFGSYQQLDWQDGIMQIGANIDNFSLAPATKNLCVGGTGIASGYSNGRVANNAFDDNLSSYWEAGQNAKVSESWIGYKFPKPVLVHNVGFSSGWNLYAGLGIPYVHLEYSDDGESWTNLATFDYAKYNWNGAGSTTLQYLEFDHNHISSHLYWRIRFEKGTSVSTLDVYQCLMYQRMTYNGSIFTDYTPIITAPTSFSNPNEVILEQDDWDRYINNSVEEITNVFGDNSIWNCKYPSFTSTYGYDAVEYVVIRGGNDGDVSYANKVSSYSNYGEGLTTGVGFRPKLILKKKNYVESAKFFHNNGQYKTYSLGKQPIFKDVPHIPDFTPDDSITVSIQNGFSIIADTGTKAYKLLNRAEGTWLSTDMETTAEIIFDFGIGNDKRTGGYVVEYLFDGNGYNYGESTYQGIYCAPRNWEVYGSATGAEWVLVDKRKDEVFKEGEMRKYFFDKPCTYRFFKIVFISNNSDPKNLAINYINFYDTQADSVSPFWKSLSTTMPSQSTIRSEGLKDLSVLDRKRRTLKEGLEPSGSFGDGSLHKIKIDLNSKKNINEIKII
ncbi:putative IG domain containing protein group 2 domain [Brevibacillus phage Sundance]|uniref:putative IG domain containing protein group 2 domain n=1 Tax=Brevibacillus phage Sundance TaxID=1691958 RepID=UPI0006BCFF11|nr:putative IG domain containing protein group 2 domain [Brevibacillus phage Sundance]ALA47864.1 putative IG domain containing protein group 2 domain [Brevibacillus phage Sundance]